ncbi:MAG: M23 family metallopeptidase, partial [Bacteroidota bacterium]
LSASLSAQLKRPVLKEKRIDSLKLLCPVPGAVMLSPSQEGVGYKGDVKVIFKSAADTLFLAPADGKIDLITTGEGGKYEIVMHYYNYNLWFTGISKVLVKQNDTPKKGQPIGRINPGDEVELLLFDDEEPVDPKKYLDCKK